MCANTLKIESQTDRLNQLALPNSHLVEAVLKEHYHIFNEDCRDRLKKLLQLILNVNRANNIGKLHPSALQRCYIRNLRRRIKYLEHQELRKKGAAGVGGCDIGPQSQGSLTLDTLLESGSFSSLPSTSTRPLSKSTLTLTTVHEADGLLGDKEALMTVVGTRQPRQRKRKLSMATTVTDSSEAAAREAAAAAGKVPGMAGNGDQSSVVMSESGLLRFLTRSCSGVDKEHKGPPPKSNMTCSSKPLRHNDKLRSSLANNDQQQQQQQQQQQKQHQKQQPQSQHDNQHAGDAERVAKTRIDLKTLTIKYYMILILDMQKNCQLYEKFTHEIIKPTEAYKQEYFEAAYNCWMEYLAYIKHTLEYLHPYIMSLRHLDGGLNPPLSGRISGVEMPSPPPSSLGDVGMVNDVELKLPRVLITCLKNMKPWRRALQETVQCCRDLVFDENKYKRH